MNPLDKMRRRSVRKLRRVQRLTRNVIFTQDVYWRRGPNSTDPIVYGVDSDWTDDAETRRRHVGVWALNIWRCKVAHAAIALSSCEAEVCAEPAALKVLTYMVCCCKWIYAIPWQVWQISHLQDQWYRAEALDMWNANIFSNTFNKKKQVWEDIHLQLTRWRANQISAAPFQSKDCEQTLRTWREDRITRWSLSQEQHQVEKCPMRSQRVAMFQMLQTVFFCFVTEFCEEPFEMLRQWTDSRKENKDTVLWLRFRASGASRLVAQIVIGWGMVDYAAKCWETCWFDSDVSSPPCQCCRRERHMKVVRRSWVCVGFERRGVDKEGTLGFLTVAPILVGSFCKSFVTVHLDLLYKVKNRSRLTENLDNGWDLERTRKGQTEHLQTVKRSSAELKNDRGLENAWQLKQSPCGWSLNDWLQRGPT